MREVVVVVIRIIRVFVNNCFCLDGEFVNKVQQNKKYDKKLTLISGSRDKTIKIWKSGLYS